jgi:hypothetical protein
MTYLLADRQPPLAPLTFGGKIAISCLRSRDFLIRAWAPRWHSPEVLVNWILHHVGRIDLEDLEWWGYTYGGQPSYMLARSNEGLSSGLTIQRYVAPPSDLIEWGEGFGPPEHLEIPEKGIIQPRYVRIG